jgi:hypothetical protein
VAKTCKISILNRGEDFSDISISIFLEIGGYNNILKRDALKIYI